MTLIIFNKIYHTYTISYFKMRFFCELINWEVKIDNLLFEKLFEITKNKINWELII